MERLDKLFVLERIGNASRKTTEELLEYNVLLILMLTTLIHRLERRMPGFTDEMLDVYRDLMPRVATGKRMHSKSGLFEALIGFLDDPRRRAAPRRGPSGSRA
ncbi:MAG: hypothetical protein ACHQRJ_18720 [Alphaproteobacteria bacterium]